MKSAAQDLLPCECHGDDLVPYCPRHTPLPGEDEPNAAKKPDPVLDGYSDWLNEAMFGAEKNLDDGERVMWLGEGRWVLTAPDGPDVWLIEITRAEVVAGGSDAA